MDLKGEFKTELINILNYWAAYTPDHEQGGFYGKINRFNEIDKQADKGSVLNSRILWTFSAAYTRLGRETDLQMAERSFAYIKAHFIDPDYGGVYWTVKNSGQPADTKKQIYAQAFAIYALAEFYRATQNAEALQIAKTLFSTIEKHSYDAVFDGYFEAFSQNWALIDDLRLSEKDANEKKTMNTHLHILEAYANLYKVWPDAGLQDKIKGLIDLFLTKIINPETNRLNLFFNEKWVVKSTSVSYGHDIETAWLLYEAAETAGTTEQILQVKNLSVKMASATIDGVNKDGSMLYEYDPASKHTDAQRQWWVQAESVVGFLYAFQLSNEPGFYTQFLKTWQYIKNHIIDHENGEWIWGINAEGNVMESEDKVGLWKCCYHNARMCLEVMGLINSERKMLSIST